MPASGSSPGSLARGSWRRARFCAISRPTPRCFWSRWLRAYLLDRYGLLTESSGAVFGAGYTAVHVRSWALLAAALLTMGCSIVASQSRARARPGGYSGSPVGYLAAMILLLIVLPISVQRFVVLPNELALEEPYLQRDIEFTRQAFGLASVQVRTYDPKAALGMAEIDANQDTIGNIRLWDWQPLQQTFRQLQQIRSYYTFQDVDIDRYGWAAARGRYCSPRASCRPTCPARASPGSTGACSIPTATAWSWRRRPTRRPTDDRSF